MYAPLARREEEIEIEIADEHVLDHAARQPSESESESETGTKAKGGLCCVVLCCVVLCCVVLCCLDTVDTDTACSFFRSLTWTQH